MAEPGTQELVTVIFSRGREDLERLCNVLSVLERKSYQIEIGLSREEATELIHDA